VKIAGDVLQNNISITVAIVKPRFVLGRWPTFLSKCQPWPWEKNLSNRSRSPGLVVLDMSGSIIAPGVPG